MRALLDVNALVAMIDHSHVHSARLHAWWRAEASASWASCAITQNGFVRIISQTAYERPCDTTTATNLLRVALDNGGHAFWPNDISIADKKIFDHSRLISHRQITDVYLLALAVKNGGRLISFDKGIPLAAVRGAKKHHLVSL